MDALTEQLSKCAIAEFQPEDIECFFKIYPKKSNDASNKLRERILVKIHELNELRLLKDPIYGEKWCLVKEQWGALFQSPVKEIRTKAGRGHHYDFLVIYEDATTEDQKIEFKYNSDTIETLPQFLSVSSHQEFMDADMSYAEFYYRHYLDKYIDCDKGFAWTDSVSKPSLEKYIKWVHSTNYDIHPFFRELYRREHVATREKKQVVRESISAFLQQHIGALCLDKLSEKLQKTQEGKTYALWKKGRFHVQRLAAPQLSFQQIKGIHKNNTIVVTSNTHACHLLLRWRNHAGILYPAWQISLRMLKL